MAKRKVCLRLFYLFDKIGFLLHTVCNEREQTQQAYDSKRNQNLHTYAKFGDIFATFSRFSKGCLLASTVNLRHGVFVPHFVVILKLLNSFYFPTPLLKVLRGWGVGKGNFCKSSSSPTNTNTNTLTKGEEYDIQA